MASGVEDTAPASLEDFENDQEEKSGPVCSHDECTWRPEDRPGSDTVATKVLEHKIEEHDGELFPGKPADPSWD